MTAFARESTTTEQGLLTIELRSVNHRYLDCTFKLPDAMRPLEPKLRDRANTVLARGKVDCLIRLQANPEQATKININVDQLDALLEASATIAAQLPQAQAVSPLDILQFPGICRSDSNSDEALMSAGEALFNTAVQSMNDNRQREGEKLAVAIIQRIDQVEQEVNATRTLIPALMQQQRERVLKRIADLDIEVNSDRLEQELVHLAQKADVDEELDRLDAHITEVRHTLAKGGPCGRRLDFLMQELNREANTLSSKSVSSSTTQNAVSLKVLIEQMREQIQNIE